MARSKAGGVVSFWSWFGLMFVLAIPCVGWLVALVLAFADSNPSRKNFCRAHLAWLLVFFALWIGLMVAGLLPELGAQWKPVTSGSKR